VFISLLTTQICFCIPYIAQEFGDGLVFDDDDFNNDNMTIAESLVPLEEEIQEIEEEGNIDMLAEEINEIEEEIEGLLF